MPHDVILKNGLVVTPTGVIQGGVAVEGEQIVAIGASATLGQAKREIDVQGKIIFPGTFDPHVHFGISDRFGDDAMTEDFLHDTKDCLIGGVTTIATTTLIGKDPLLDLFDHAVRCGTGHSWCDFKITCVVNTLEQVQAIPAVARKGGVSYKFFTGYAGPQAEGFGMNPEGITPAFFHQACEQFAHCGPPTFAKIHAEDPYVQGALTLGADADIVVIDPEKEVTLGVARMRMRSRADYSLWEGRNVKGVPVMTFLRGVLVMENGEIVGQAPTGKFVEQIVKPRRLS
jgi:dihydroorotase-like cyclic amidohydrolase